MAKLTLSSQLIEGLKAFSSLNEEQLAGVISYTRNMPIDTSIKKATKYFHSDLGIEDAEGVFLTIVNTLRFIQNNKKEDVLNDIIISASSIDGIDIDKIRNIFSEFLSTPKNVTARNKAADLLGENNDNFNDCKIITDIRLVFEDNIAEPKRSAILIHKLHFELSNPSRLSDIFIHLDKKDLLELKDVIERAILKEDLIKEDYENINFISF